MLTKEEKADWEKSVRLNNGNRANFIRVVIEDIMPDAMEPTIDNFAEKWENTLYDVVYSPETQIAMKACPSWMFHETQYYFVNMDSEKEPNRGSVLKFKAPRSNCLAPERESSDWGSYNADVGCPTIAADHAAAVEYKRIGQQRKDWIAKKNNLQNQLRTVSEDCNTSHQLYEAWPAALNYSTQCFPYTAPAEVQRGGRSSVSAQELDIGVMMAKSNVNEVVEN
jgi:hypothetical protein